MFRFLHRQWRRHVDDERLILWLDGELPPNAARAVALHLDKCDDCRVHFQRLERTLSLVRQYRQPVPDALSRNFEILLKDRIDRQRKIARYGEQRTSGISWRAGWAVALAGAGLTLAAAMPSDARKALFQRLLEPMFGHLSAPSEITTKYSRRLAAPAPPPQPAPIATNPRPVRTTPTLRPLRPSASERETAEVDVRYALHRVQACMGEQIDYSHDRDGYVFVQGLVDTAARKEELEQALAGIHWLHTRIRTIEESLHDAPSATHAVTSIPLLTTPARHASDLRKLNVPEDLGRDRILEISRQAIAESSLSMQHAWSIRHILSAYSEERLARLPAESRGKLVSMLLDHTTEWQHTLAALRQNVRPMLELELAHSGPAAEDPLGSMESLFAQAEQLDVLTRSLFADSDEPYLDPVTAVSSFYAKLSALESTLTPNRVTSLLFTWGHCGQEAGNCHVEATR